jgi:hypothetical protein
MNRIEKNSAGIYKSAAGEQAIMALYDSVLARWPVPHETRRLKTRHAANDSPAGDGTRPGQSGGQDLALPAGSRA